MINYFKKIFNLDSDYRNSIKLYRSLTLLSRNKKFYNDLNIPDTIDGRFETLSIILFLFFKRINDIKSLQNINQNIANIVIADLDQSIREMGVGDMGIIKRIKNMGKSMWGRFYVYNKDWGNEDNFKKSLIKNVYRKNTNTNICDDADKLYLYIVEIDDKLKLVKECEIKNGDLNVNI